MMPQTLLDTDVLSSLLRNNQAAVRRAREYTAFYPRFTLSLITQYEILRGLKAKAATTRIHRFEVFCEANDVLPIDERIVGRAAEIYATLRSRGQLIPDADILIAATALEHGLVLATNNISDFARIGGLQIDNWLT